MPYYMWTGSYTRDAAQALIAKPQNREAAARKGIEAAGGKVLHLFIAMGSNDIVALYEMPDDTSAAALSLALGAGGAVTGGATTKLMTFEDFAKAMKKAGAVANAYKPPKG